MSSSKELAVIEDCKELELAVIEDCKELECTLHPNQSFLTVQRETLTRLISKSDFGVTEIAKKIDVGRQTIYNWLDGLTTVPEKKLIELCKILNCSPAEVRYGISVPSEEDMAFVFDVFDKYVEQHDVVFKTGSKSTVMARVYFSFMSMKRAHGEELAKEQFQKNLDSFFMNVNLQL